MFLLPTTGRSDEDKNAFKVSMPREIQQQPGHMSCSLCVIMRKQGAMEVCIRLAERCSKWLEHMSSIQDIDGWYIYISRDPLSGLRVF
jgi:hypothetical protein